jgi:hypothetical protein
MRWLDIIRSVVSAFQSGLIGSMSLSRILSSHRGLRYDNTYACTLEMCLHPDKDHSMTTAKSIVVAYSRGRMVGRTHCGVNKRHLCFA